MSSPFVYTDRDYVSLRNQMTAYVSQRVPGWTADPSDFAYSLIESMAYLGDMMSYYVDRAAMESNILTANSPRNIYSLARLFGYSPGLAESAWCRVVLTNNGTADVTVVSGTKVGAHSGGYAYEIRSDVNIAAGQFVEVEVLEGESKYSDLGVSSGAPHQMFLLPDTKIDGRQGSLTIITWDPTNPTDQEYWTYREILMDSPSSDYVFSVHLDPDGSSFVTFGDGVAGRIPKSGWNIGVYYRTCHGAEGNAPGATLSRFLASWDDPALADYASVEVYGESPAGGQDIETTEQIRQGAVRLVSTQRRAVTSYDYESIARADSKVLDALCEARVWSRPTVWIAPRERGLMLEQTLMNELEDQMTASLKGVALAGVQPVVRAGSPLYFTVDLEIIIPSTIDADYAISRVKEAIYEKFSHENGMFGEPVPADHIIRAINLTVPTSVVQFARVVEFSYVQNRADWKQYLEGTTVPMDTGPEVVPEFNQFAVLNSMDDLTVTVVLNTTTGRSRF